MTEPILIGTGCPGTGKTTIARKLLAGRRMGAWLCGDRFFEFLSAPIPPVMPESNTQNAIVTRALARAAEGYYEGGYEVVVDGVIGPWFVPAFLGALGPEPRVDYAVLQAPLDETVRRASTRPDAAKFPPEGVRQMHRSFADLGALSAHAIDTEGRTIEETLVLLRALRESGQLRLRR